MLSFPLSKTYAWELAASGQPDMRKAQNRRNVCDMVTRLHEKLEETVSENRVLKAKEGLECDSTCPICMEPMQGTTILKCGHSLCAACFAQHSRLANTCPFCRDEFAPKPRKPREQMPREVITSIIELYVAERNSTGYIKNKEQALTQANSRVERRQLIADVMRENGEALMYAATHWYDSEH